MLNTIPNFFNSKSKQVYNNISSISGLAKILSKNSSDLFEIGEQIKKNNKNLLDSFSIPFKYIQNDILKYIPKKVKENVKKNSILTKIYQGKYGFDILKKFTNEISKINIKNFKISDYISLFKEFIAKKLYNNN
jgi:hypothetical protein